MSIFDSFLNAIKLNDDFDEDEDDDFFDDDDPDEDEDDEEMEEESEAPRTRRRFFGRFRSDEDDDDEEDDEDDDEEDDAPPARAARTYGYSRSKPAKKTVTEKKKTRTEPEKPRRSEQKKRESTYSETSGTTARSYERTPAAAERSYERTSTSTAKTYERTARKVQPKPQPEPKSRRSKVTPIRKKNTNNGMGVNVIRPSSMEDTRDIADDLMAGITVILNLEGLDIDMAQRVTDFTCGVCYALHGSLQKVSGYIFILTPDGVEISGDYQSILEGTFDLPAMRRAY